MPDLNEIYSLVAVIDERTKELKNGESGDIPEIKRHLAGINGNIRGHDIRLAAIETRCQERYEPVKPKYSEKIRYSGIGVGAATFFFAFGKLMGWF